MHWMYNQRRLADEWNGGEMLISFLADDSSASAKVKQESQFDFPLPHRIPTLLTVEQLICAENLDEMLNEVHGP